MRGPFHKFEQEYISCRTSQSGRDIVAINTQKSTGRILFIVLVTFEEID